MGKQSVIDLIGKFYLLEEFFEWDIVDHFAGFSVDLLKQFSQQWFVRLIDVDPLINLIIEGDYRRLI